MANDEASKVISIIQDLRIAMVSTHSAGRLDSRP